MWWFWNLFFCKKEKKEDERKYDHLSQKQKQQYKGWSGDYLKSLKSST
tara:strand:+ start:201 stop:344 length:144 start_codon:yes stop_codon:yes gene_type:complete